jgi:hypothetical protein
VPFLKPLLLISSGILNVRVVNSRYERLIASTLYGPVDARDEESNMNAGYPTHLRIYDLETESIYPYIQNDWALYFITG